MAEASRKYLDAYGAKVYGLQPARHHQVWVDKIHDLVAGRSVKRRLLIIAPPGCAKSTWVSLIFPAWYLGNHPDESLLFLTSSGDMAVQFGTTVKNTIEANGWHALAFPDDACRPDEERGWSMNGLYLKGTPASSKDPAYRAVGWGASVIGSRAHGIIVDDPLTQEEAQAPLAQSRARQYYDMTLDNRLHPDGWMLAIMTAWAEADLRSHLLASPDWETIVMPALGYWGEREALWPERFPRQWLEQKRRAIGGPQFAAVYQGDPQALGGSVFKSGNWFRPLPSDFDEPRDGDDKRTPRQRLRVVQFWDLAWSELQSADYTACVTLGIDSLTNLYILHAQRKRVDERRLEDEMINVIGKTRPQLVGVEAGAFKQAATRDLVRRVQLKLGQQRIAAPVIAVPVDKDKVTRAQLPAGRAESGLLFADRDAPWWPEFESEMLSFPLGAHDDYVDAVSGCTEMALERIGAPVQEEPTPYQFVGEMTKRGRGWDPLARWEPRARVRR